MLRVGGSRRLIPGCAVGLVVLLTLASGGLSQYSFGPSVWVEPDTLTRQGGSFMAIDSEGNPCIAWFTEKAEIRFARSTDGGETFLPYIVVDTTNAPNFPPRIALDAQDNPHLIWSDAVYDGPALPQVKYARSTDKGRRFVRSFYVGPDTTRGQFAGAITVDEEGNPMIVWHGYDRYLADDVNTDVYFTRSYDGGLSFEPSIAVDPHPGYQSFPDLALDSDQNIYISYSGDHWSCYQYVFVVKSTDGGQTFTERVWVDRDLANNFTSSIAVVPSLSDESTVQGYVAVIWNEDRGFPDTTGVYFAKSADGGETFGDIAAVTEGPTACILPSLAADVLGNLVVVWESQDVLYFSYSTDKGTTFAPRAPVDSAYGIHQAHPDVAMDQSGTPMVTWTDSRPPHISTPQVYFSKGREVGIEEGPAGDGRFTLFQLEPVFPNPFSHTTTIFFAVGTSNVGLKIYDLSGRLVKVLVDEEKLSGSYSVRWDGTSMTRRQVPSGIYFCRLEAGEFNTTRKLSLLR